MFPHSPGAPAGEVVNCRCHYESLYVGDQRPDGSIVGQVSETAPQPAPQPITDAPIREVTPFNPTVTFDDEARSQNAYFNSLSGSQQRAIKEYVGMGYGKINRTLRGEPSWPQSASVDEQVRLLDSVIRNVPPLSGDALVYRGLKTELDIDVGDTFTDLAYVSTTMDKRVATGFAQGANIPNTSVIEIRVPAGSRGLVLKFSPYDVKEILFGRNTRFRVLEKSGNNLVVELVNEQ